MEKIKKAIIIDDEPLVRDDLRHLLEKHPQIKIIGEAGSIKEAETLLQQVTPDVVFLDIQLRGGSGFDLVPSIKPDSRIIFFTAHDEYAFRAFEVNALDYLLKPVVESRLAKAITRLEQKEPNGLTVPEPSKPYLHDDQVFIKTEMEQRFIAVNDISAITSLGGNYTSLRMANGKTYTTRQTQKHWEDTLPGDLFLRIHRSSLININRIESLKQEKNCLRMLFLTGMEDPLEVSRRLAPRIKKLISQLKKDNR